MSRFVDLSHPLTNGQLSYPGDPPIEVTAYQTEATGGCNLTHISLGSHHGTHLDAPYHFLADGPTLDRIPLERFCGPARLVDLAPGGELEAKTALTVEMFAEHADAFGPDARVIYRTGWSRMFGRPEFFTDLPSLTVEAARWIAERQVGLLGMDVPTPSTADGRECHQILLGPPAEIVIVEGLTNLESVPRQFTFVGFPLNFCGRDGSPIRAVAMID